MDRERIQINILSDLDYHLAPAEHWRTRLRAAVLCRQNYNGEDPAVIAELNFVVSVCWHNYASALTRIWRAANWHTWKWCRGERSPLRIGTRKSPTDNHTGHGQNAQNLSFLRDSLSRRSHNNKGNIGLVQSTYPRWSTSPPLFLSPTGTLAPLPLPPPSSPISPPPTCLTCVYLQCK